MKEKCVWCSHLMRKATINISVYASIDFEYKCENAWFVRALWDKYLIPLLSMQIFYNIHYDVIILPH